MEIPRINVFIIDNNKDILKTYSEYFKINGINVVGTAYTGNDAIQKITNCIIKPDVIVIDRHIPILDGIETSNLLLNHDKSFKIIIVGGDSSIKKKARSNKTIEFYEKFKNIKHLCKQIKEIVN